MSTESTPLDPLTRLAIKHGADKWGEHQYTPVYHSLFQSSRDLPIRLLEIGVGGYDVPFAGGASLRMWAEYFPQSRIVGFDISPKRLSVGPRITVLQGSQDDGAFLHRVWDEHGPFDIIVDDGSHIASHVLASFRALYPLMPSHGIYVIEDTQTAFWPGLYSGSQTAAGTIFPQAMDTMMDMHRSEIAVGGAEAPQEAFGTITASVQVFRNMVCFLRGPNTYPSNGAYSAGHPEIRFMLDTLRTGRSDQPAFGSYVTEAVMLANGGQLAEALACNDEGRKRFPRSVELAYQAVQLAERLGDNSLMASRLGNLAALAPADPLVTAWIDKKLKDVS